MVLWCSGRPSFCTTRLEAQLLAAVAERVSAYQHRVRARRVRTTDLAAAFSKSAIGRYWQAEKNCVAFCALCVRAGFTAGSGWGGGALALRPQLACARAGVLDSRHTARPQDTPAAHAHAQRPGTHRGQGGDAARPAGACVGRGAAPAVTLSCALAACCAPFYPSCDRWTLAFGSSRA